MLASSTQGGAADAIRRTLDGGLRRIDRPPDAPGGATTVGGVISADGTILIALDSASPDVLDELLRRGRLPHLRTLLADSTTRPVETPVGTYVGSLWYSFAAAAPPSHTGMYCWEQVPPGQYRTRKNRPAELPSEPFWSTIARAGCRTAAVDLPLSALRQTSPAVQVVDWGTHRSPTTFTTNPPELAARVAERHGEHPLPKRCDSPRPRMEDWVVFRDQLTAGVAAKGRLAADLLGEESWDLFAVGFSELHCAGHQAWHLHDPAHPRHVPSERDAVGDPIADTYEAIDHAVGELLASVPSSTRALVLLSHGMGPHYDATHLIDPVLRRLDRRGTLAQLADSAWLRLPWGLRRRWSGRYDSPWRGTLRTSALPWSPARRRFFHVPNNDAHAGVRVNLEGREPDGQVPAKSYDAVCDLLVERLSELRNPDTGERVAARVDRLDRHAGPRADALPDIVIEWSFASPVDRVASDAVGVVTVRSRPGRSGDHRPGGRLITRGGSASTDSVGIEDIGHLVADGFGLDLAHRRDAPTGAPPAHDQR